jgi:hypothetical protein
LQATAIGQLDIQHHNVKARCRSRESHSRLLNRSRGGNLVAVRVKQITQRLACNLFVFYD